MESVVGVMKRVAEHEARRILTTELGVVTAVFPHADEGDTDNYEVSVQLRDGCSRTASGWSCATSPSPPRTWASPPIPNVGDLVLVQFIGGDVNAPVITGRLYNDENRPPPNLKDELLLRHKRDAGASVKLDAEGRIVLTSKSLENTLTLDDEALTIKNEKFSLTDRLQGREDRPFQRQGPAADRDQRHADAGGERGGDHVEVGREDHRLVRQAGRRRDGGLDQGVDERDGRSVGRHGHQGRHDRSELRSAEVRVRSASEGSVQAPSARLGLGSHLPRNCRGRLGCGAGTRALRTEWCGMVSRPPIPRPSPTNSVGEG